MKALLLPFGYPGYPEKDILKLIEDSKTFLSENGIDFVSTNNIIRLEDCKEASEIIKSDEYEYIIVLVTCWIEVINVITLVSPIKDLPMLLWCHGNIYEKDTGTGLTYGAIASAGVLRESFEEFEYNFKFVVGNPFEERIVDEILSFGKAARAISKIKKSRVGLVGYASMGMYTGMADHIKVKKLLGAEIVHVDQYTLLNKLDEMNREQLDAGIEVIKNRWDVADKVSPKLMDKTVAVYLRLKEIIQKNQLDSVTVKCQYEMSLEYGYGPCFPLSVLGEELPVSCEGDVFLILSQMILNGISGKTVTYGDLLEFLEDGVIFIACGYAPKPFLKLEKPKVSIDDGFISTTGLLISSPFKEGKVTVIRLANHKDGFKMHLIKGYAESVKDFHEVGCPQYCGTVVRFENKGVEEFKQEIMSQHYAIVFGDYEHELRDYCKLMKIKIV